LGCDSDVLPDLTVSVCAPADSIDININMDKTRSITKYI
jgi:hypothetical protein